MNFYDHLLCKGQDDYPVPPAIGAVRAAAIAKVASQLDDYHHLYVSPAAVPYSTDGVVKIGTAASVNAAERDELRQRCEFLKPWKKGQFEIFGLAIDGEWRSDWKFARMSPHLQVAGKRVADIGCHNGYYMLRLLADKPEFVVGFEPNLRCYFTFHFLQQYIQAANLYFEPFGVEHLRHYQAYFDVVLCWGILYHQLDPVSVLRTIHHSLVRGGKVIIDCQGIAGEGEFLLLPRKTYAGATGTWYLPTRAALMNWLQRTNFRNINIFYDAPLSPAEQRATSWSPIASLQDFLNADGKTTIEGYPAPRRFYVVAQR
ncbi:MAG: tRNA 5-methoxyuridine(34)/uridine 5-oxyacetic acid(34) synthase CmoB [Pseudomonadota bacterium]|nr:tRNA 5-methoxyuridine(34)/uridine 5-oxyacetic acid(34) synthase CmoB [Pseudomonadota bacterium]